VANECVPGDYCNGNHQCLAIFTIKEWPTATAINYGQTLAASTLSGGGAIISGVLTWTSPATVPAQGSDFPSVTLTTSDLSDYSPVSSNAVHLTVNRSSDLKLVVNTIGDSTSGVANNCSPQTKRAVNSTDQACSLRDALAEAGVLGSASFTFDSTAFASAQVIGLANGTLKIPLNTSITGPTTGSGSTPTNLVTVDGSGSFSIFTTGTGPVAISNLIMAHGNVGGGNGGEITNNASLTLTNCAFNGIVAGNAGGAIINYGTLTVANSSFSGNQSSSNGGAILNLTKLANTITNSTFSGNSSANSGGAILDDGTLTVTTSTFSNDLINSFGGAIDNSGTLTVTGSSLSGPTAGGNDGVINTEFLATTTGINDTFYGNLATSEGGALYNQGTVNLTATTVSGNSAATAGAGVFTVVPEGPGPSITTTLANSVVSGNTGSADTMGGYTDNQGNIVGSSAGALPLLGNYGGPTLTMVPLPGSPAICAGRASSDKTASITTDQRGFPLAADCPLSAVDSGAVQTAYAMSFSVQPPTATPPTVAMNPAPALSVTESYLPAAGGTVSIAGSSWPIGGTTTAAVSAGAASFSNFIPTNLTTGETLKATLALNPTLTPPLSFTAISNGIHVTRDTKTNTFTPIPGPNYVNGSVALSATATSGLAVTFVSYTPSTCTVSNASGWTASFVGYGSCTLVAQQSGGAEFASAPNVEQILFVHHVSQTISFPVIVNDQVVNTTIPLSATSTSGLEVTFASTAPSTCTVSGASGWSASLIACGSCTLEASQPGNCVYAAALVVSQTIFVHHLTQTISSGAITGRVVGTPLTLSATASSGLAVEFAFASPSVCTVSGTTASFIARGSCTIQATQPGSTVYSAAPSVEQSFKVTE
jgi:predicted outer membrane repeat protein